MEIRDNITAVVSKHLFHHPKVHGLYWLSFSLEVGSYGNLWCWISSHVYCEPTSAILYMVAFLQPFESQRVGIRVMHFIIINCSKMMSVDWIIIKYQLYIFVIYCLHFLPKTIGWKRAGQFSNIHSDFVIRFYIQVELVLDFKSYW